MNISNDLLNKYAKGLCSEGEKILVEKWMKSGTSPDEGLFADQFDPHKKSVWSLIKSNILQESDPFSPFKNIVRYAAAACILLLTFFGGRFSVNTANANPIVNKLLENHLYIFGGDGGQGNLPGENFKIVFKGTIKLYNSSLDAKSIQVGDTSFILRPYQDYYLSGSPENPTLLNSILPNDAYGTVKLEGDFSMTNADIE
ncbi:MAG: hypothetical protein AAF600_14060 [Bacteroidota bacterium]